MKIELELNEVNYVLNALSHMPYGEVADLINKIKTQGEKQVDYDCSSNE